MLGLFLVFFGWSALNWLNRPRARSSSKGEKSSSKKSRPAAPWLGAGIGGAVIGFLFFSYLASILTCIISTRSKDLSATAFFAVWLASGALGAVVGGRWKVAGWTMAGLAAGPCLTLIVTAMFGIHTLLIRIILVVVFTMLLTAPLLVPRHPAVHRLLLISCTSIVGIVTFLDGVALFAPPEDSSASWLDLWVVFFAADDSASETAAMKKWGSSAFKGYIAGAVLGAVIGSVFEAILHKHAGEDPEAEWNDYLGTYTERFENGTFPGAYDRAGMFEPTPSPWRKIANLFANARTPSPASYGNLPGGGRERSSSPLTERSGGMGAARRARSTRSARSGRTARGAPARFEALSKRDKDLEEGGSDSESDATEFDSDDEDGGAPKAKMIGMDDGTPALATLGRRPQMENYGGYALPKPPILSPAPSYTTAAPISSTLSGSTAKGSDAGASSPIAEVEKALAVYRDGDAATERATSPAVDQKVPMANIDEKAELRSTSSPPPASASANASANAQAPASPGARMVPATPSLINAISRIQQAQEQTRAWHASQPPAAYSAAAADAAEGPDSRPTSPPVGAAGASAAGFDKWWKKEVGERS